MSARAFDAKFGPDFLAAVPTGPGVYEALDASGVTIYVGKAKSLRARLSQYRLASRKKVHRKQRAVVAAASSFRLTPCKTELEALLLENARIQALRPRLNVAGAYAFLYPCVGVRRAERDVDLVCTTSPDEFSGFRFYGAFRDRALVREAFDALAELLDLVAHREPASRVKDVPRVKYSRVLRYRRLEARWVALLEALLRGESQALLSQLVLALVERPAARRHADETQAQLERLRRLFVEEARPLRAALEASGRAADSFVPQGERDPLFLRLRGRE